MALRRMDAEVVLFRQSAVGAVPRSAGRKLEDLEVSPLDFNARGNGIDDDTDAVVKAANHAITTGKTLTITDGYVFLVSTFANVLDSGTNCAVKVTGNLAVRGRGIIKSNTATVANSIFGIDAASGAITFSISKVGFSGASRYRAVFSTPASAAAIMRVEDVITDRQSIILAGTVTSVLAVRRNNVGILIAAGVAVSPTLTVTVPAGSTSRFEYSVKDNTVWTGTELISTGAIVIHGMPPGGECISNTHYNVGPANNEGFDIDNLGQFAKFRCNTSWGAGFEYKTGTQGYSDNRDIIFSENISYNSWHYGFTIQSSCIGFGNVAYNPTNYGIYATPNVDVDGLLDKAHIVLKGFLIIYAGSAWTAGLKLVAGYKTVTIEDLRFELDPAWDAANPAGSMPANVMDIDGDVNDLVMRNVYLDRHSGDGVNIRPTTRAARILLENFRWGGSCGDSCFDLLNCDNVTIVNPVFPAAITDRPVRFGGVNVARITCDYHPLITLAQTSGGNTGVLINNWGQEAAGAGLPPTASAIWPQGCIVKNTSDGSLWLRYSESAVPATAWKQIA